MANTGQLLGGAEIALAPEGVPSDLATRPRESSPACVRLMYILTNGDHVPIEEAWFTDRSMVTQLVEYPSSFEIVPPFGVEMMHAMAHTENRPRLQCA